MNGPINVTDEANSPAQHNGNGGGLSVPQTLSSSNASSSNESAENLAEDFQEAWSAEMVNLNSDKEAFSPSSNGCNSHESNPSENFAAQWFNSICEATKMAAKKTLPKKSKTTCFSTDIGSWMGRAI